MSLVLSHPSSLEHDTGDHPERALRLSTVFAALDAVDWLGWERAHPAVVEREVLELVHPASHVDFVAAAAGRAEAAGGRVALDADTVVSAGSYTAALHACGGAVELVQALLGRGGRWNLSPTGGKNFHRVGFSLHRPPGHHAPADQAMGFCLFNNIAVAARYAIAELGLERVAIVDWDVHHGNGTQDIFWSTDEVLFCSIHQMPLYPGSGAPRETGAGAGAGFTLNLPVPAGSGDDVWVRHVRERVVPRLAEFEPQLVLVSAGFDAHRDDPLAGCQVSEAGFARMATLLRDAARAADAPLGLVLEGGYATDALARSVIAVMEALGSD